jgi:hypothetical protein
VMCKRPKKMKKPSNFYELWSKEVHTKKHLKKKNFDV